MALAKRSAKKRKRRARKQAKLAAIVLVVAAVAVGAWYVNEQRRATVAAAALAAAKETGAQVASVLQRQASEALAPFEALYTHPGLAEALAGSPEARAAVEREMLAAGKADGLLRARLLPAGVDHADYSETPPFDYAGLALLRRAIERGGDLPAEAHSFGHPQEHIALLRAVRGANDEPIGHVLLQIDAGVLTSLGEGVSPGQAFVTVMQRGRKAQNLFEAGSRQARLGEPLLSVPVRGTAFRVQYWQAPATAPVEGEWPLPPAVLAGLGGAAVLLGGLALYRRRVSAARADSELGTAPAHYDPMLVESEPGGMLVADEPAPADPGAPAVPGQESTAPAVPDASLPQDADDGPDASLAAAGALEIPESIFRAYDVRGVYAETLTADIVREIGRAIGSEAHDRGQNTVAVACDGRNTGPELKQALTEGLLAAGRDVVDVGSVPTPVLYFATYFLNTGSGVMVTGSHNPPEYNGLKIMLGGETLFGDDITALRERIESKAFVDGNGSTREMDVLDEYVRRISEDIPVALGSSLNIVVDCGNGIAGAVAPKVLRALGHDVAELFCEVDGNFPNHHPDPSEPANLQDLISAVTIMKADVGFAFDGDGDRLGVVDAGGNIIWPDRQMMLFCEDVLRDSPGGEIIFDVKCSSRLAQVIEKHGGKPVMWKTGHSFMKNKLRESQAPLAGEMSGHIFFNDRWYGFDDAVYAAARMVEIMLNADEKPPQVFASLPSGHSTPELKLEMAEGENVAFMARLEQASGLEDGEINTIDGVRVDWPDGWGLVRASNTTPSLVLRFEGDTEEALARVQEQFRKVLLGIDDSLRLPF